MAASNTTTNFGLNLTDFDKIPWGEEQHNNWHIVDALMARFIAISLIQGAWENALIVVVGDRYIDADQDLIYEVLVAHTTPSTGTFAAARIATAANWQAVTVDVANKGTYAQATVYAPNNFVQDGGRFGIVQTDYTSNNTAATTALSYDADVTNGDIITLIDASELIAATHDTNTVATGGTPTATYTAATSKFNFGLVTGATGATGATGPGSGTVTSVSAGDGMSFSAVTTTGAVAVDSTVVRKNAASVMADNTMSRVNLLDYGEITNAIGGTGGGTQDIDLQLGNSVSATVDTGANTFTFSDPTASDELCGFTLTLVNGGSQTVNWPGSVDWAGGSAPSLTASGTDILTFFTINGGTLWHGMIASADSK